MIRGLRWGRSSERLRSFAVLGISLAVLSTGCSTTSAKMKQLFSQQTSNARELYCESAFRRELLEQEGVTVLAARVNWGHETYGPVLVQGLAGSMQSQLSVHKIVHPNLAVNRISAAGLTQTYATMLTDYDRTNILSRKALQKVGKAVQARYFALPILVTFQEDQSSRLSAFGLRAAKTASATARLQLQIWDAHSGRIVWEGLSDVTMAREMIWEGPIHFDEIIQTTWAKLLQTIPSATKPAMPEDDNEPSFDATAQSTIFSSQSEKTVAPRQTAKAQGWF